MTGSSVGESVHLPINTLVQRRIFKTIQVSMMESVCVFALDIHRTQRMIPKDVNDPLNLDYLYQRAEATISTRNICR